MTMDAEKTPLWLEIRKEYIDDNLDKLIDYLKEKSGTSQKDSFYETTIGLLRERVEELLTKISQRPIYEEEVAKEELKFNLRILAAYLLVEGDSTVALSAYVAFMSELRFLNPRMSEEIFQATMNRLVHANVANVGFSWSDISQIGTELFVHNACKQVQFEVPLKRPLVLENYGTAMLTKDGLMLTYEMGDEALKLVKSGANSVEVKGATLRTRTTMKLKASSCNNLVDIDEFANDFIVETCKAQKGKVRKVLKEYSVGDEAIIEIISIERNGDVLVETVDPAYTKISGRMKFEEKSLVYYYTDTLYQLLKVGDCFKSRITSLDNATFSIDKSLVDFFIDDTKGLDKDEMILAKVIDEKPGYYGWINEFGIGMFSQNTGQFTKGDYGFLKVSHYGKDKYYGKIYVNILDETPDEYFEEKDVRHDCIRAFAESVEKPHVESAKEEIGSMSPLLLRLLLRLLFLYQKSLMKPLDRLRYLVNANAIAEIIDENLSASYIRFARTYLRLLVQFANKEDINRINLDPDPDYLGAKSTLIRLSVVSILKEYGKKEDSQLLAKTIADFNESLPLLARLARLVQTANSMQGTLSDAVINVVRREIIKILSVETENETDLEAESGDYLGIESGTQEFKTSFVYPSGNNMQPDEYAQNFNVLKGICAFLNASASGVLYLGVNDQGYVTGVENDMKFLKLQTIDAYMRYVQDTIKKYLGIDSLPYVRMEPLYGERVVAIHVEPHPYRVVELEGEAYLRVNAESRLMPESMKHELIASKIFKDKNKAAAISALQHAMGMKRRVILHNYASSHSGSVRNRRVEAYAVYPEDGLVMCLDLEDNNRCKVFNISRIGYVETLTDEPWKFTSQHEEIRVDAFHWSGKESIKVGLQLDLYAKNALCEEFPRAKDDLLVDGKDENIWYYSADVYALDGVGRFYLGLADHIKILDAPELEAYAQKFAKENIL